MTSKILIVKLGSIGDVIHCMPAVARLRRILPGAQLHWLVERYAASILSYARNVDRVIEIDTVRWRRSLLRRETWTEMRKVLGGLREVRYDAVLDFQGLWKSASIGWLVQAKQVVGWDRPFLREPLSSIFYSRRMNRKARRENVIDEHLRLVEAFLRMHPAWGIQPLEFPPPESQIEFEPLASDEDRSWAGEQVRRHQLRDFILVNPGANWKSKLWPVENYALLIKRLLTERGMHVVISAGPGEQNMGEQIRDQVADPRVALFSPTLNRLAALAERAKLFIGPDTGPLHIAAACRTPIVGIYAPTDPVRNGPYSSEDIIVQKNRCGEYCYRRDCGSRRCITAISVEEVFQAVQKRLEQIPVNQEE
jgi:heptosyltransferase I